MKRFPRRLRKKKDPEILPELMSGPATLVTLDATLVEENSDYIPDGNPGVIVVRLRRPTQSVTTRIASRILQEFKARFPGWADVSWNGIYLEITEAEVLVSRLDEVGKAEKVSASYSSPDFDAEIKAALHRLVPTAIEGP